MVLYSFSLEKKSFLLEMVLFPFFSMINRRFLRDFHQIGNFIKRIDETLYELCSIITSEIDER
jgi:hypothetical protein